MTAQNFGDCRGCRYASFSKSLQSSRDFSSAPQWVFLTHRYDSGLHNVGRTHWTVSWPTRQIVKTVLAVFVESIQDFIASVATDPEAVAQRPNVRVRCLRQSHKFPTGFNGRLCVPRHGYTSPSAIQLTTRWHPRSVKNSRQASEVSRARPRATRTAPAR